MLQKHASTSILACCRSMLPCQGAGSPIPCCHGAHCMQFLADAVRLHMKQSAIYALFCMSPCSVSLCTTVAAACFTVLVCCNAEGCAACRGFQAAVVLPLMLVLLLARSALVCVWRREYCVWLCAC